VPSNTPQSSSTTNSQAPRRPTRPSRRPASEQATSAQQSQPQAREGQPRDGQARDGQARQSQARQGQPRSSQPRQGLPRQGQSRPRSAESTRPAAPVADLEPTTSVVPDLESFAELDIPAPVVAALTKTGVTKPFAIQAATLTDSLAGRDVIGRGKTGSGKTVAFALPIVSVLSWSGELAQPFKPRAIVLVPTRELATQVAAVLAPLAAAVKQRVTTIFGGVTQERQVRALRDGVDIVIACPGRLEDLMKQRFVQLDKVEITVLDEADHMADLGFLPGVKRILDATPKGIQRLLFSATLDNGIDVIVQRYLDNPAIHSVDPPSAAVSTMEHHILSVSGTDEKNALVRELASGTGRSLLFMRTKHAAKKLSAQLTAAGIPSVDLHGNLAQNARDRNLAAFSSGEVRVLVATDVAARGVHVDDIELVVHVDPPTEHKAYLHRSGRTARAGASGIVVTVVLPEQQRDVALLMKQAGIRPEQGTVTAAHPRVRELVGEKAAPVIPVPKVEQIQTTSRKPRPARAQGASSSGGARTGGARTGSSGRAHSAAGVSASTRSGRRYS
jgi:superfamily II DNA/RNA helicase